VGFAKLDQALPVIESVANVADVEILATAAERYAVLRRFSPRFLAAFRFQSNTPNDPLLAEIELLKEADQSGRALPKELPSAFLLPKWRRMIFAGTVPDRRLYETAVLAILRDRLRGADVWVAGSRNHRAFEDYLLPEEPAGAPPSGIGGEIDPERYVAARARLLHERLLFVARRAGRGELDGVEIEDGSLYVARTKPTVPETARLLAGRLYGMLPRVRVTEVMGDVAQLTGFASCFTHLRTGYPASDIPALLAAILADGTNLGLSRMADATRGLSYHHLVNMRSGISTKTTTPPAVPRSSMLTIGIRWPPCGVKAPTRPPTGSISAPAAMPEPPATSTPSTGSTRVSCFIQPNPASTARCTPGSFPPRPAKRPTCWTACIRRRTEPACASPSTTPIPPAPRTMFSACAISWAIASRRASRT